MPDDRLICVLSRVAFFTYQDRRIYNDQDLAESVWGLLKARLTETENTIIDDVLALLNSPS